MERELPLHGQILQWCIGQIPSPAVIHSDPSRKSRMTPGAPDFMLLWSGRCILIECKDREGKLSHDQQVWHHLAELNGFPVSIVRSMSEFLAIVNQK